MENMDNFRLSYAKKLNIVNFTTTASMPIDANVNIKTILNIDSYIFDENIECGNGKAVFTAKLGFKILYIDTDNISNTITYSQSINETFTDTSITSNCFVNSNKITITNNILSTEGSLKIACDIAMMPTLYVNLAMNNNIATDNNLITKQTEISATTISKTINTQAKYTTTFETKDNVVKILCHKAYFVPKEVKSGDGVATIEGRMISYLLYENNDNEPQIKEIKDAFSVRFDVDVEGLSREDVLDLSFAINPNKEIISTDREGDNNIIIIDHFISLKGVAIKPININVVEDAFSVLNEVDITLSNREYFMLSRYDCVVENISNEITLADNETAIDELVSNLNMSTEITNSYIKDNNLYIEGLLSSSMVYIDENKDYKQKQIEIPFVLNTNIKLDDIDCCKICVDIEDCKFRVKRGTIIEMDYQLSISVSNFDKENKEIVDNITIGKPLDFSAYDYQIYIAKPNETLWQLCKRIYITPDKIREYNKNLPDIMNGGEKIIIKR